MGGQLWSGAKRALGALWKCDCLGTSKPLRSIITPGIVVLQVQHEVKRKERDAEKLRGRLREMLSERSREARVALEAVGHFQKSARGHAKKSDEAMYQVRRRV